MSGGAIRAQPHRIQKFPCPNSVGWRQSAGQSPGCWSSSVERSKLKLNGLPGEKLSNIEHPPGTWLPESLPRSARRGMAIEAVRRKRLRQFRRPSPPAGRARPETGGVPSRTGHPRSCDFGNSPNQVAQHVSVVCSRPVNYDSHEHPLETCQSASGPTARREIPPCQPPNQSPRSRPAPRVP
jgi:hypothetical protein